MILCTNCKKELPDGAKFCDRCGTKVEQGAAQEKVEPVSAGAAVPNREVMLNGEAVPEGEFVFCPVCGDKIKAGYEFCPKCGSNIMQQLEAGTSKPAQKQAARGQRKRIAGILLAVAVLLGAGTGLFFLIRNLGKDYANRLLYVKDNKLFMADEKGEDGTAVSRKLDEEELPQGFVGSLQNYITVYKDDKRIVYPEKMTISDDGSFDDYSLYYRSLKDAEAEPVKIDSGIQNAYRVTEDGNRIFYQKDSALYAYDFEKKEKIASDVSGYEISEDGSRVVYLCETGLYYKEDGKDKQKLSDSVRRDYGGEFYVTRDFSKVTYVTEDGALYQTAVDGKKSRIADNLGWGGVGAYDSGELYYCVSEEMTLKAADCITDDMSPSEPLAEPAEPEEEQPDPIYREDFESDKAYKKASKKFEKWLEAWEAYNEAYEAYEAAVEQSETIAAIMQEEISVTKYTYYYYDGTTSKELGTSIGDFDIVAAADDKPVGIFYVMQDEQMPNLKLSDIWQDALDSEEVYEMDEEEMPSFAVSEIEDALDEMEDGVALRLAVGGVTQDLGIAEEIDGGGISPDGSCILYLEDGNLMQITVKDGKPQPAVAYDTDVAYFELSEDTGNDILYLKGDVQWIDDDEYELIIGDFYKNKEKIDEEVRAGFYVEGDVIYYRKDYDEKSDTATLMAYQDGKAKEIAVDVYDFTVENQTLYYRTDWDDKHETGSIYCAKGKEPVKMADDVWQYYVLGDGSFYYLADYDEEEETSDLYLYQKKENKLVETDVQGVIVPDVWPRTEEE